MKNISDKAKFILVLILFAISVYGFMIKLPVPFRGIDLQMHALFFFLASAFLNILFQVKKLNTHLLIFGMLFLFSALIEFAQEYSNSIVGKIHGRFDPQDLKYNLMGLASFSLLWFVYYTFSNILRWSKAGKR